ncbi:MAG: electron transfer flavoprotein beta subunit/FixA family protein [Planctomycetota bacterium]|nr:MAG: electron transfer flavoprotein beta subunit/FixA family protein [Planctomycetota bacterium]
MHTLVLIKRVPDTASKITIAPDGKQIDPSGLQFVLNPYDEFAVEAALQLKEAAGEGSVRIMTLGPKEATQTIRSALAMGADEAFHIVDDRSLRDAFSTARTLADAIAQLDPKPDLILCGRQSVDAQAMATGPMVATLLGLPCVSDIVKLERDGDTLRVEREIEGGVEVLEVGLPAVLTTNKGLNEPRYASLKGIMKAKKKKIHNPEVAIAPEKTTIVEMRYPPAREGGRIVGEGPDAVPELVRLLREECKVL